jgi:TRAP-type mannitol/chloroaromatic compound transport system substrate-binding protein
MDMLKSFAADIEKMSGGRLKIEVLPAGTIVGAFEILDAVQNGLVDAGQWWTVYAFGKNPAGSLFSAPLGGSGTGLDQNATLSWYMDGGGRELYVDYYQKMLKADVMPFLYAPDGPEALGWFKKPIKSVKEFENLRFRMSSGLPTEVLKEMGGHPVNLPGDELIPAAQKGIVDGIEWINPANDSKVGLYDVFKYYSLQGLHQAVGIADFFIRGDKWRSLSPDLQAIVETAATASIMRVLMFFMKANAVALQKLKKDHGVTVFPAPADYAPAFQKAAKKVLNKYAEKDAFFKKVLDSQIEYAETVVPYYRENVGTSLLITKALPAKG